MKPRLCQPFWRLAMADKSAKPRIAAPTAVDFDIIWPNDVRRERRAAAREARRTRGQVIGRPRHSTSPRLRWLDGCTPAANRSRHRGHARRESCDVYRVLAEQDDDRKQTAETDGQIHQTAKPVRHRRTDRTTTMAYIRTHETSNALAASRSATTASTTPSWIRKRHPRSRRARLGTVHARRPA